MTPSTVAYLRRSTYPRRTRRQPQRGAATSAVKLQSNKEKRSFDVVVERDQEGYYVASVPAIPGCHTQAKSLDELSERIREAIEFCLEIEGVPDPVLEFVGIQRVTIAA